MLELNIDVAKLMAEGRVSGDDLHQLKKRLWNENVEPVCEQAVDKRDETVDDCNGDDDDDEQMLRQVKVPRLSDTQLCMFLVACNCHVDKCIRCILSYFQARFRAPHLFNKRIVDNLDVSQQLKCLNYCVFPTKTPEGYTLALHRLVNTSAWAYRMDAAIKVLFMALDAILYDDLPNGLIMLFDMKGVGLMHLARVNFKALQTFFFYLQEALPIQLKAIHVFNSVSFLDRVLKIIRPFMKDDIYKMIHFHAPDLDMDEFFAKHISKELLPVEYGGTLTTTVDELHDDLVRKLIELEPFFAREQEIRDRFLRRQQNGDGDGDDDSDVDDDDDDV